MKVFVNDIEIDLIPGMSVRHALIHVDLLKDIEKGKRIFDQWGNELGLDGAVVENVKIYLE